MQVRPTTMTGPGPRWGEKERSAGTARGTVPVIPCFGVPNFMKRGLNLKNGNQQWGYGVSMQVCPFAL